MRRKKMQGPGPSFSTTMTCKDETDLAEVWSFLTREGRSAAATIMYLVRCAMKAEQAALSGNTTFDIEEFRKRQQAQAAGLNP